MTMQVVKNKRNSVFGYINNPLRTIVTDTQCTFGRISNFSLGLLIGPFYANLHHQMI